MIAAAPLARCKSFLTRLRDCTAGTSVMEFALITPVFLGIGMYGIEIAYMSTVNMQVSQMALTVADNASRLGQTDNSAVTPTVSETDVNAILEGVTEQGEPIDFAAKGRVILSSLEVDDDTGLQFIHWQRCTGALEKESSYGNDSTNNGLSGDELTGMGDGAAAVTAEDGAAVMFAEVYYDYEGLFGTLFVDDMVFRQEAAFLVRDDRNLAPGLTGTGSTSDCSAAP
jgi:hypothetical protein